MKRYLNIFILLLLSSSYSYGDGWHVSDRIGRLREPIQKAVISWDGRTETLVLSAAVQAEEIANFAWIVPIPSSVKPDVSAGDISVFEELADYFRKDKHLDKNFDPQLFTIRGRGGRVEVLESKEIGVYDITILKAECAKDLISWLNDNAYIVPEDAGPILEEYIERNHAYFVANKIDLRNKYADEIAELYSIYERRKRAYWELCDRLTQYFHELGMDDSIYHFDYRNTPGGRTNNDFCFLAKEHWMEKPEHDSALNILTRYLTDVLNEEFRRRYGDSQTIFELENGWSIRGRFELFLNASHEQDTYGHLSYMYVPWHHDCHVLKNGEEYTEFHLTLTALRDRNYEISSAWREIAKIERGAGKYADLSPKDKTLLIDFFDQARGRLNHLFHQALKSREQTIADKLGPILAEINRSLGSLFLDINQYHGLFNTPSSEDHEDTLIKKLGRLMAHSHNIDDIDKLGKKFEGLYFTLEDLRKGVGTPLKIKFQPPQPCYPLRISSLNTGKSRIDVFVLATRPVIDQNSILRVEDSKMITRDLREEITKHINVGEANYVTKLTYWGELEKLSADAVFTRTLFR